MSGATYQVQPPEPFTFSRPSEWPKWLRRFERFRTAAGLAEKGEEVQVNTLLYSMGDDADDILRSFQLSHDDQNKYAVVKEKFNNYFVKKHNVIYERAKFNRRKQEEGETVDAFVTDLHALAEHCAYGVLHEEMIRDRLVVGIRSAALSENMQLDSDLTLEKAVTQARQAEAVKLQQPLIRSEGAVKCDLPVAVYQGKPNQHQSRERGANRQRQRQSRGTPSHSQPHADTFSRCGLSSHNDRAQCPARDAVCRKCRKRGHYQRVCRSQASVEVIEDRSEPFLGTVGSHEETPDDNWVATVWLNDSQIKFQIDTGAEVTVIPGGVFEKLSGANLHPSQRTLRGASQIALPVIGKFTGKLTLGDRTTLQEVYVVDKLHKPLLGRPAIEALGLLARVRSVNQEKPIECFPQLFQGLGRMQGEYSIQLKEGAVPFALTAPRRVAIPLMESVKAELQDEVEAYIQVTMQDLPATEKRLAEIQVHQEQDETCKMVRDFCKRGWPKKAELPDSVKPFYAVSGELVLHHNLLMRGSRLVIPRDLQPGVLRQLHSSHQGISKCRERARQSVWWPGLSKQLEETVRRCSVCTKFQVPRVEPLMPSQLPSLPWQKVGTDLFEWEKSNYLLVVDYLSRWIEIAKLEQTTSRCVINHLSSIFARYGVPELVISDNGPQYSSESFKEFSRNYGFRHNTSSPHYPQANGEAERAVQTIKGLLKKAADPYLAMLAYRSTPLALGYTPSELLMGRKLRTTVPMSRELRKPSVPNYRDIVERDDQEKQRQARNYDARHRARALPPLAPGETVYVRDRESTGTVVQETTPRSYEVRTPEGTFRRNRHHIVRTPSKENILDDTIQPESSSGDQRTSERQSSQEKVYQTRSKSGRAPKPPERFDNSWNSPRERGM